MASDNRFIIATKVPLERTIVGKKIFQWFAEQRAKDSKFDVYSNIIQWFHAEDDEKDNLWNKTISYAKSLNIGKPESFNNDIQGFLTFVSPFDEEISGLCMGVVHMHKSTIFSKKILIHSMGVLLIDIRIYEGFLILTSILFML